jgi:hypothetical protein
MRAILAAVIVVVGMGALGASSALAGPANGAAIVKAANDTSQVVTMAGGCGRGWHRGPRGGCRRN